MKDTYDAAEGNFVLGDWRVSARFFGKPGSPVNRIDDDMNELLDWYDTYAETFEDIVHFHVQFENIHPFHNGNGRVGRLLLFKELVYWNETPLIIFDNAKEPYYHGLDMYHADHDIMVKAMRNYQRKYEDMIDDLVDLDLIG